MAAAVLERASARGRRVAESCEFGPVLTGQKNRLRFGLVRSSMVHFYTSGTEHDPSPCRKSPPRGSRPSARFLWIRCYARALARARSKRGARVLRMCTRLQVPQLVLCTRSCEAPRRS